MTEQLYQEMLDAYDGLPARQACKQTLRNLDYKTLQRVASRLDMAGYPNDKDTLIERLSGEMVFQGPVGDPNIYRYVSYEEGVETVYTN